MKLFRNLDTLPKFDKAIVTIGSFDGVHLAHKKLINRINLLSNEIGGEPIVVTFHPHPRSIVFPGDKSLKLLTDINEKISLLEAAGVKNLVIVPFTVEFAQLSANEYVEKFLVEKLNTKYLVVGYDHKFGLARQGDFQLLKMYEKEGAFQVIEIEKQAIDEQTISSTNIRNAINQNDFDKVNSLLDGYYPITGKVVKGDGIGRTIGYHTANISIPHKDKLIPEEGIYACQVDVLDRTFDGMLYIGNRPTINNQGNKVVEVNIFDFNEYIYDETITVKIVKYLRGDKKFTNLEQLKLQLDQDRLETIEALAEEKFKKKSKTKVAVAILNYNGADILPTYLPSVIDYNPSYSKIVIIDNKSLDNSIAVIQHLSLQNVDVIKLAKNHGFAEGYNQALSEIDSEYTLLLNSDVKVTAGYLDPLIEMMDDDATIAAVQPKILSYRSPDQFEHAGASGGFLDVLAYPYCRGRIFDTVENDEGQYDEAVEIFWASGAAMLIRTNLFKAIGGFDKDFFAHQEEIDLCWRLKRAGYKICVEPKSVVYHLGGATLDYDNPRKVYLNFRNNLLMLLKNTKKRFVTFHFIIRLILDGIAGLKFLFDKKPHLTLQIIKAHFAVYALLPSTILKRTQIYTNIQDVRIGKNNKVGHSDFSILWKYFVQKRKTYNNL
jgi:riboflavin kinase/FMN adenylyltransferase